MAAIPKLYFKIINLPNKLIFTTQYTGEPINSINTDIKSNDFPNQDENNKHFAYCMLAD